MSESSGKVQEIYVRAATIPVVECLEMPWGEYLEKQYLAWDMATRLANAIVFQLICKEEPTWMSGKDTLRPTDEVFGKAIDSFCYELANTAGVDRYSNRLPSSCVAPISRNVSRVYAAKRRGAFDHLNDSLPLFKFPYPIIIRKSELTIDKDPKDPDGFILRFPLLRHGKGVIENVTLRVPPIKRDKNTAVVNGQMPLLEKLRTGLLKHGDATITADRQRVSFKQARTGQLPTRKDRFGFRYVYRPIVNIAVNYPINTDGRGRHGLVFIHTDPNRFLVTRPWKGRQWNMHMEHVHKFFHMATDSVTGAKGSVLTPQEMRRRMESHDAYVLRLREDAKANYQGSRVKSQEICGAQSRRIRKFIEAIVAGTFKKIVNYKFAEVAYFDGDRSYFPHFDWVRFRESLKGELASECISFHELDPMSYNDCRNEDDTYDYDMIHEKLRVKKSIRTRIDRKQARRDRAERTILVTETK